MKVETNFEEVAAGASIVWEGDWHTVHQTSWGQIEAQGIVAKAGVGFSPGYQISVNMDEPEPHLFPAVHDFVVATKLAESLSHSHDEVNAFFEIQQQTRSSLAAAVPPGFAQSAVNARADSIALLILANERGVEPAQQVLDYLKTRTLHAVDPTEKSFISSLNEIEVILQNKPEYYSTREAAHVHGMAIGLRGANAETSLALNSQSPELEQKNPYLKGRSASIDTAKAITQSLTTGPIEISQSAPKLTRGHRL